MAAADKGIIRTALFVPGNRPDRIDKAINAGADAVIIDLEDAVALSQKKDAGITAKDKVRQYGRDNFIIVRVNSDVSGFLQENLEEIVVPGLSGVMLPKVEKASDIETINQLLTHEEKNKGIKIGTVAVFPLIESALAIQDVFVVISTKTEPERLFTAAFGAADYTMDMGIEITKDGTELIYPRSRIAVACRSAGLRPPLDTPFMIDIKDVESLKVDARRAKQIGFGGKLCIHPIQIGPCNQIFSPTQQEIDYAKKIIEVFEKAEKSGTAAVQLEGKFIDYPVVERSRRILNLSLQI